MGLQLYQPDQELSYEWGAHSTATHIYMSAVWVSAQLPTYTVLDENAY